MSENPNQGGQTAAQPAQNPLIGRAAPSQAKPAEKGPVSYFYSPHENITIIDHGGEKVSFRNHYLKTSDPDFVDWMRENYVTKRRGSVRISEVDQAHFDKSQKASAEPAKVVPVIEPLPGQENAPAGIYSFTGDIPSNDPTGDQGLIGVTSSPKAPPPAPGQSQGEVQGVRRTFALGTPDIPDPNAGNSETNEIVKAQNEKAAKDRAEFEKKQREADAKAKAQSDKDAADRARSQV